MPGQRRHRVLVLIVLALVGCGDDGATPTTVPAAPVDAPTAARRHAAVPDAAETLPRPSAEARALAERLRELWATQRWDSAEVRDAEAAFLALGPDAAIALLPLLGLDTCWPCIELFRRLRDDAAPVLLAGLRSDEPEIVGGVIGALWELGPQWGRGPHADAVARALVERVQAAFDAAPDEEAREVAERDALGALGALQRADLLGGEAIAADLAAIWRRALGDEDHDYLADNALWTLEGFGSAAAPGGQVLLDALGTVDMPDDRHRETLVRVLARIGAADSSLLPALGRLLESESAAVRRDAALVLWSWGDAAAPLAPRLEALTLQPDEEVRAAALVALATMPTVRERPWLDLLRAASLEEDVECDGVYVDHLLGVQLARPDVGRQIAAAIHELSLDEVESLLWWFGWPAAADAATGTQALASSPDPAIRALAVEIWRAGRLPGTVREESVWGMSIVSRPPAPDTLVDLLADPDPRVRLNTAMGLLDMADARAGEARAVLEELAQSSDAEVAAEAQSSLEPASSRGPPTRAQRIADLGSDDRATRWNAVLALAADEEPIGAIASPTLEYLAADLFEHNPTDIERFASVIARCDGGMEVLAARLRAFLEGEHLDYWDMEKVLAALRGAGDRAPALRDVVDQAPFDQFEEYEVARLRTQVAALFAVRNGDAVAFALGASINDQRRAVATLLGMGREGRYALILYAGRVGDHDVVERLPDGPDELLRDALRRWGRDAAGSPHREIAETGLADLASALADAEAVEVIRDLLTRDDEDARVAAARSLHDVARRAPAAVPADLVTQLLDDNRMRGIGLGIATDLGNRARPALPALRRRLDDDWARYRMRAALLVQRLAGDDETAAATVRDVLAGLARTWIPPRDDDFEPQEIERVRWSDVAEVLLTAGPEKGDVALLTGVIPPGDTDALFPVLEPLGEDAAPALPLLREAMGPAALRVLAAIGPGARAAAPDVRRWIIHTGDPEGLGRAVLDAIE